MASWSRKGATVSSFKGGEFDDGYDDGYDSYEYDEENEGEYYYDEEDNLHAAEGTVGAAGDGEDESPTACNPLSDFITSKTNKAAAAPQPSVSSGKVAVPSTTSFKKQQQENNLHEKSLLLSQFEEEAIRFHEARGGIYPTWVRDLVVTRQQQRGEGGGEDGAFQRMISNELQEQQKMKVQQQKEEEEEHFVDVARRDHAQAHVFRIPYDCWGTIFAYSADPTEALHVADAHTILKLIIEQSGVFDDVWRALEKASFAAGEGRKGKTNVTTTAERMFMSSKHEEIKELVGGSVRRMRFPWSKKLSLQYCELKKSVLSRLNNKLAYNWIDRARSQQGEQKKKEIAPTPPAAKSVTDAAVAAAATRTAPILSAAPPLGGALHTTPAVILPRPPTYASSLLFNVATSIDIDSMYQDLCDRMGDSDDEEYSSAAETARHARQKEALQKQLREQQQREADWLKLRKQVAEEEAGDTSSGEETESDIEREGVRFFHSSQQCSNNDLREFEVKAWIELYEQTTHPIAKKFAHIQANRFAGMYNIAHDLALELGDLKTVIAKPIAALIRAPRSKRLVHAYMSNLRLRSLDSLAENEVDVTTITSSSSDESVAIKRRDYVAPAVVKLSLEEQQKLKETLAAQVAAEDAITGADKIKKSTNQKIVKRHVAENDLSGTFAIRQQQHSLSSTADNGATVPRYSVVYKRAPNQEDVPAKWLADFTSSSDDSSDDDEVEQDAAEEDSTVLLKKKKTKKNAVDDLSEEQKITQAVGFSARLQAMPLRAGGEVVGTSSSGGNASDALNSLVAKAPLRTYRPR